MKHSAVIHREFVKIAVPEWWKRLSLKEQRQYISTHPKTLLRLYRSKDQLRNVIKDNLKKLPFIKDIQSNTDFYNNPQLLASTDKNDPRTTRLLINMSPEHFEFAKIHVNEKDRGKNYSTQLIKSVRDAIINSNNKDVPVYVSEPRNQEYWNHIKSKFPELNWRM